MTNKNEGVIASLRHRKHKERWWSKIARLLYFRLIIPIYREKDSPKLIAYSVAIGLFVGFTPSVGFQMPLLAIIWWIALKLFKFHFSLIIAIAWSWLSNGATMIPLYYLFYITGRLLLPGDGDQLSFEELTSFFSTHLNAEAGLKESLYFVGDLIEVLGSSLLIGCIPWAIGTALLGYWLSLRAALTFQRLREERFEKKRREANLKS